MTRGWFTGLLLGRIDRKNRQIARGNGDVAFPQPLLREDPQRRDLLPAILESLGLAYAEVAQHNSLDSLDAYLELRDLGLQPGLTTHQAAHIYGQVNAELEWWVRTGDPGRGLAPPVVNSFMDRDFAKATSAERRDAAVEVLTSVRDDYRRELDRYRARCADDPSTLGAEQAMWPGMSSLIDRALNDLRTALLNFELVDINTVM
jgi:hypothetical protein